ncbi:MAG TPA: 4Fe-4S binding protein, partial [Bacteroidota bacterium]
MKSFVVLKRARVALSLFFFVSTVCVLVDLWNAIPPALVRVVLFLQFTPSLVNFVALGGIAACGFAIILLLTLLFGRMYCSTICPLGTLQDIVSYLSRRFGREKYHKPLPSHAGIHPAFLAITLLPLAAGTMFAVTLLDPFSNFGRLSASLILPLIAAANNFLSSLLEVVGNYAVYPVDLKGALAASILFSLAFLVLLVWMAFRHGRLYCNSICPVGSLLRIVAGFSLYKIAIEAERCKSCQLCQRVCKSGCIDRQKKIVDFSRCVDCFNCLDACPSGGLQFVPSFGRKKSTTVDVDGRRRSFLLGSSLMFIGGSAASDTAKVVKPQHASTIPGKKIHEVTPPGSSSLRHFAETCTACHVCISSCPPQVLQPALFEYGFGGVLQPRMDFSVSYCNFECTRCTEVCPSGALKRLTVDEKKLSQAGTVVFVKQNCVVYTENTDCGA